MQIEAADLPCPVYRTARRLLDLALPDSGHVTVSEADYKVICQSDAEGTMRSHLVQLAGAGIVSYSRRGLTIRIRFEAWANPLPFEVKVIAERSDRALVDHFDDPAPMGLPEKVIDQRSIRALSDQISDEDDIKLIAERSIRALSDQKSVSTSHARSGGWVGPLLPQKGRKKGPTHPPKPSHKPAEQQLALGLLIDPEVGISYEVAQILAATKPAQDIYRLVDEWLPEHRDGKVKTGALVSRLKRVIPSDTPTVTLSAGFLVSDLFQRHRLPAEMIAEPPRRKYSLDEAHPEGSRENTQPRRKYSP